MCSCVTPLIIVVRTQLKGKCGDLENQISELNAAAQTVSVPSFGRCLWHASRVSACAQAATAKATEKATMAGENARLDGEVMLASNSRASVCVCDNMLSAPLPAHAQLKEALEKLAAMANETATVPPQCFRAIASSLVRSFACTLSRNQRARESELDKKLGDNEKHRLEQEVISARS